MKLLHFIFQSVNVSISSTVILSYKTKSEFSVKINTALYQRRPVTCLGSPHGSWDRLHFSNPELEKWKKLNFCFLLFKSFPQICSRQLQHEIKAQFSTKALPMLYHTETTLLFSNQEVCAAAFQYLKGLRSWSYLTGIHWPVQYF